MGMSLFATVLAFQWFTHEHGLFTFGFVAGFGTAAVFFLWERIGWCSLFSGLGAALMALAAHFLRWWR